MGVITSSLASFTVIILIPLAAPFVSWEIPTWEVVGLALLAGSLIQISQAFYFQALAYSEAGIVAAYWNMEAVLLPILSFIIWSKVLTTGHYAGIAILVFTSVCFCLVDVNFVARWRSFLLMTLACCFQATAVLVEKHVFGCSPFFVAFLLITAGIIFSGSLPLALPQVRHSLRGNLRSLRPALLLIVGIEVVNLVALFMSQRAISLGIPSLVAAVETTVPAYSFILACGLYALGTRYGDPNAKRRIWVKLSLAALSVVGVYLVAPDV